MHHIYDLVNHQHLEDMISRGYIACKKHPRLDLELYCYTHQAQYDRMWNNVTKTCRGLVVDGDGMVVARPFPKFFNHNEVDAGELDLDAPAVVYDKLDGSLIIGFSYKGEEIFATKRSFVSDQAVWAAEFFEKNIKPSGYSLMRGATYLFEAIYPGNQIVIDYKGRQSLVLLGILDGKYFFRDREYPGDIVDVLPAETLRDALKMPPRPNAEGLVVYFPMTGNRVKVKQEDYVKMHRIVFGLNERVVWEKVVENFNDSDQTDSLSPWISELPEEFHPWVRKVVGRLEEEFDAIHSEANSAFWDALSNLDSGMDRKKFAQEVQHLDKSIRGLTFLILDKQYDRLYSTIWDQVKPRGDTPINRDTQ